MSELLVTGLDPTIRERILQRARRKRHTLEEEIREILRSAAEEVEPAAEESGPTDAPREGLGTRIANRFRDLPPLEEELQRYPEDPPRPVVFED